jgi:hypothetical protein
LGGTWGFGDGVGCWRGGFVWAGVAYVYFGYVPYYYDY